MGNVLRMEDNKSKVLTTHSPTSNSLFFSHFPISCTFRQSVPVHLYLLTFVLEIHVVFSGLENFQREIEETNILSKESSESV